MNHESIESWKKHPKSGLWVAETWGGSSKMDGHFEMDPWSHFFILRFEEKKPPGIWWHEKLGSIFGVIHAMTSITPGGRNTGRSFHLATSPTRIGKSDTKNIFSLKNGGFLKWWIFIYHGIMEYLQTNHLLKKTTTKTCPSHVMDDPFSQKTSVEFSTPKMKGN